MTSINRNVLLHTMIKHETLTIDDILKKENLGVEANVEQVKLLINELQNDGSIEQLNDVVPETLTITVKGISEYAMLTDVEKQQLQ